MNFIQKIMHHKIAIPNQTAIVCENEKITYDNLIHCAEELSEKMLSIKSAQSICILLCDRSIFFYKAMLACFIGNFIYTPINIHAPLKRNQQILQQIDSPLVLISAENSDSICNLIPYLKSPKIVVDNYYLYRKLIDAYPSMSIISLENMSISQLIGVERRNKDDIAYLLFTSGSTGIPKGALISYKNINAYIDSISTVFQFEFAKNFSQICDISFDLSLHEILLSLVTGGTLCVYPDNHLHGVARFLYAHSIDYALMVPTAIPTLNQQIDFFNICFEKVQTLFFCGEPFPVNYASNLQARIPKAKIINLYGPTEVTIACAYHEYQPKGCYLDKPFLPIGMPFPSVDFLISDNGELLISGDQCFSGYLSQTRLISNTYKTGDLVVLSDNNYYFISRIDDQWKIHGYRLEKNDIENRIRKIFNNNQVWVVPRYLSSGLIEQLVIFSTAQIDFATYHAEITSELPPAIFVPEVLQLNEIPTLPNHKIDYKKLQQFANR